MRIKTKSGFKCEINERKLIDRRFIELYAGLLKANEKKDEKKLALLSSEISNFLLDENIRDALGKHIEDKDGIQDISVYNSEVFEILSELQNSDSTIKKSLPSQD